MILLIYIIGYGSLAVELIFFHVPSIANTQNFFKSNKNYNEIKSPYILKIYKWSILKKILILAFPYVLINLYFIVPFLYFFPKMSHQMLFIFEPNKWTDAIGLLFVILGRTITFGSMLYLRKENRQKENSFKLHVNGIFSLTRNPGLDGMFLFFAGFSLVSPTLIMWLGLLFYFYYMRFRVKIEEAFLIQLFGESYKRYMKTTKRFLFLP